MSYFYGEVCTVAGSGTPLQPTNELVLRILL